MNKTLQPCSSLVGVVAGFVCSVSLCLSAACSTTAPPPTVTARSDPSAKDGATAAAPAKTEEEARVLAEGLVTCFPAGTMRTDKPHKPATCEVSAVVFVEGRALFASDKAFPPASTGASTDTAATSSVFSVEIDADTAALGEVPKKFLTASPILRASKFEDFALAPEGDVVFLTTGFDRSKDDGSWDGYNTLLAWPPGAPEKARAVHTTQAPPGETGETASLQIRNALQRALADEEFPDGRPYFKVEALVALQGRRLLFGIREHGASYKKFEYALDLIEARYQRIDDGRIIMDKDSFKRIYRAPNTQILGHRVAISSLAWDEEMQRLVMLSSFEHEDTDSSIGAFLLTLTLDDLRAQEPPTPVWTAGHRPLMFGHKAEGIAVLGGGRFLIVHDDDRVTEQTDLGQPDLSFKRGLHQAAWSIVILP